jgi:hypothetical protein
VGIHHPHRRLPAGVGDPPHSDASVVARNGFEQPLDGVVGVAALVHVLGGTLRRPERTQDLELALGAELPADILEDEDVAVAIELLGGAKYAPVLVRLVGANGVRRAKEHDRVRARGVARLVDDREQLHAIAHGDHVVAFDVVLFDIEGGLLCCQATGNRRRDEEETNGEAGAP